MDVADEVNIYYFILFLFLAINYFQINDGILFNE